MNRVGKKGVVGVVGLAMVSGSMMLAAKPGGASVAKPADKQTKNIVTGHRFIGCDRGKVAIVNAAGQVEWEVDNPYTCHDIAVLPNGNILMPTSDTTIVEMTPEKQIVWKHESKRKEGYTGSVQIHAFQRLKNGRTMISESGNRRIIEVDKDDKIVSETPLTVNHPDAHRDTRRVRKLDNGHYLVCHEGDGVVREYDPSGRVVWSYTLDLGGRPVQDGHEGHGTHVFNAVRLRNGNTLIAGGDNNRVLEVNRAGTVVWSVDYNELPGIQLHWLTTLEALPNGDIVLGNTHAGNENPQLIEFTHDKKVVWTYNDRSVFGNDMAAVQTLDAKGHVIR